MKQLLPIRLLVFAVGVGAVDEDELKILLETNECQKCDLTKANLPGVNLSSAILKGVNLFGAILEGANLEGVNLSETNLKRANMI